MTIHFIPMSEATMTLVYGTLLYKISALKYNLFLCVPGVL